MSRSRVVLLWMIACGCGWSPVVRKRGSTGLSRRGWVTVRGADAPPASVLPVMAAVVNRQVVRLSGRGTDIVAVPSCPVATSACQKAVSWKLVRTFCGAAGAGGDLTALLSARPP